MLLKGLALLAVVLVPLQVVHGPLNGEPRLGVTVTIGNDPVHVLVDTGSNGLRVLATALHPQSVTRTEQQIGGRYGTGLQLHGVEALASLTVGSLEASNVPIEVVDTYTWADHSTSRRSEMFGWLFDGILGLNMIVMPNGWCCANPLPALTADSGARYIVHASLEAPELEVSPDDALVREFTMLPVGFDGWPQGCIHIPELLASDFCGDVVFDTGSPAVVVSGPSIASPSPATVGTVARLELGTWSTNLTAGPTLRIFEAPSPRNRILLGLPALQHIDVLFDYGHREIGVRSV